jgi:hypothetical protein
LHVGKKNFSFFHPFDLPASYLIIQLTSIPICFSEGHLELAHLLLDAGANAHIHSCSGDLPLHWLARKKRFKSSSYTAEDLIGLVQDSEFPVDHVPHFSTQSSRQFTEKEYKTLTLLIIRLCGTLQPQKMRFFF